MYEDHIYINLIRQNKCLKRHIDVSKKNESQLNKNIDQLVFNNNLKDSKIQNYENTIKSLTEELIFKDNYMKKLKNKLIDKRHNINLFKQEIHFLNYDNYILQNQIDELVQYRTKQTKLIGILEVEIKSFYNKYVIKSEGSNKEQKDLINVIDEDSFLFCSTSDIDHLMVDATSEKPNQDGTSEEADKVTSKDENKGTFEALITINNDINFMVDATSEKPNQDSTTEEADKVLTSKDENKGTFEALISINNDINFMVDATSEKPYQDGTTEEADKVLTTKDENKGTFEALISINNDINFMVDATSEKPYQDGTTEEADKVLTTKDENKGTFEALITTNNETKFLVDATSEKVSQNGTTEDNATAPKREGEKEATATEEAIYRTLDPYAQKDSVLIKDIYNILDDLSNLYKFICWYDSKSEEFFLLK